MLQQIGLGGAMIVLPIYLQMVLEYSAMATGLSLAPLSLSMFDLDPRREEGGEPTPERHHPRRLRARHHRDGGAGADRPPGRLGWALFIPLLVAGSGLGLLVSQLNNYTLAPISEERT